MGVFFVLIFVPIIIQHVVIGKYRINYEKRNRFALAFFFSFLTFLVMFRHESIGNDTKNYIAFFEKYAMLEWSSLDIIPMEMGYAYLNKVISTISTDPQVFIAIVGILVSALIYPVYKRLCIDASFTIVLFCIMSTFVMMFSGIRQMIAIGIGMIAYSFVYQKRIVPYVLLVFLAITFHTSAFMLFLMYPVYHAKMKKKWLYIIIPTLVLTFIFNKEIFSMLSIIIERYTEYDATISSTGAYTILLLFIGFAVFSFLIPEEKLLDDEIKGLRNLLLLALVIQMFVPLHPLAMRMNYYYIIFIPLLLPKIIVAKSEKWSQIALIARHVMVMFFLVYFFFYAYTSESNLNVFPYNFVWENI